MKGVIAYMVIDKQFCNFCENIKTYRKKNKLSQKEMAKKLHIGVHSLRRLEQGNIPARVTVDVFFYFADLCNIPTSDIFKHRQM